MKLFYDLNELDLACADAEECSRSWGDYTYVSKSATDKDECYVIDTGYVGPGKDVVARFYCGRRL